MGAEVAMAISEESLPVLWLLKSQK